MSNQHRRRRSASYGADPALLAAARLVENLAYLMPAVRAHAAAEITLVDGAPSKMPGAGESSEPVKRSRPLTGRCRHPVFVDFAAFEANEMSDCGRQRPCPDHDTPIELTSVEAAVEARLRIERWLADVEAQCKLVATVAKQALDSGRGLVGTRLAVDRPKECRDGLYGKDDSLEWGDPLCTDPAEKAGLCSKHYMSWYRHRRLNGVDTSGMFADAAAQPVTGAEQG